jgi:hypothetical protein
LLILVICGAAQARADAGGGTINLNFGPGGLSQPVDVDSAIKVLVVMTLLTWPRPLFC